MPSWALCHPSKIDWFYSKMFWILWIFTQKKKKLYWTIHLKRQDYVWIGIIDFNFTARLIEILSKWWITIKCNWHILKKSYELNQKYLWSVSHEHKTRTRFLLHTIVEKKSNSQSQRHEIYSISLVNGVNRIHIIIYQLWFSDWMGWKSLMWNG